MTVIRVHLERADGTLPVGTARINRSRGVETTEFTYDEAFLAVATEPVSPDLPLLDGRTVLEGIPGALEDSAPDAWGRNLIIRRLAALARDAGHVAPTPTETDVLLGVSDATRQGALRLCMEDGEPFLAEEGAAPPLLELDTLVEATRRAASGDEKVADDAVRTLLDAGSGSLGGARPKASVRDGSTLCIAKFPHPDDRWDVMRWEATALDLAAACGIDTPRHDLLEVGGAPVLLVERFDRDGTVRRPYLSGRSLVGARQLATYDYLELVEALTVRGAEAAADLVELWRRVAFSVIVNNVDDHMRNHAVLGGRGGWRLSPVFDVNPDPNPAARRITALAGATDADGTRTALVQSAGSFGLDGGEATRLWSELVEVVSSWRAVASARGLDARALEQFAPVLDRWVEPS